MSTVANTGGPAFPSHGSMGEVAHEGMTLRDYFAAKAMQGLMDAAMPMPEIADAAYDMADAMLRKKNATPPAAQPEQKQDSTCNKTLRAEGKGYPRTCRKCGKGPCIADRVQPEHEPVAQIIALGQYEFPGLEWLSADHSFRAPIGTLLYTTPPAAQQEPDAYGYAKRLAVAIWEQHYKGVAPQWKPFDDLMGVLTQIDNMTAGLTAQRQPLTDEEIDDIWNRYCDEMGEASIDDAYDIARAIEAAHGITGEKT